MIPPIQLFWGSATEFRERTAILMGNSFLCPALFGRKPKLEVCAELLLFIHISRGNLGNLGKFSNYRIIGLETRFRRVVLDLVNG
ncbi:MAG: hypothetical protein DMG68_06655 [Acidobacteria bacterium]|nr:MAG: hypothetical protein DMG68_06655 [Acidobacteriota bacterium]